ncbi:ADP-ribose glycohydrolase MACROD1 isoform X1 [Osmerus mordax]|uniref:ADP-ribose glycohydrolase MACROD1 isoform X1 n=1 Tax=Osmerus mordax TaxID=8014 RepID=UPI003510015B
MAFQMSTLSARIRLITSGGPLSRSRGDFSNDSVGFSVKLRNIFSATQPKRQVHSLFRTGIAERVDNFSTATVSKSFKGQNYGRACREKSGTVYRIAIGAFGVTTAVACLHASAQVAMAEAHLNLDSVKSNWNKVKETLLSMGLEDRRKHYRSSFLALKDIPVWNQERGAAAVKPHFPRNEALDNKISLFSGDITKLEVDGIVNAANKTLLGGGGVDGAIHRTSGPLLKCECAELDGCDTGQAKITGGYGLPAKYVIHTVGPIVMGAVGEEERSRLRECYWNSLDCATSEGLRSVAFPCISTGVYGYPPEQAVDVALKTVREYLNDHDHSLDRVIFCVFLPSDYELYKNNLPYYFPGDVPVKSKL